MKVLIADDDEESRLYLSKALLKFNHKVVQCANGQAALDLLRTDDPPQIVFLDWMMPGLTGLEVCEQFKDHRMRSQVFVILLTARDDKNDILTGLKSGADDYITKPLRLNELEPRLTIAEGQLNLRNNNLNYTVLVEDEFIKHMPKIPFTSPNSLPVEDDTSSDKKNFIDIETISNHFVGDEDIMRDVILSFLNSCPGMLEKIQISITQQDAFALEVSAHTLKGSVANFFVYEIQKNLGALEALGREKNLKNADQNFQLLLPQIEILCSELANFAENKKAA